MFEDPTVYANMAERIGIPATFAFLMVVLVVWFASQHRAERREWREAMEVESKLNREAIAGVQEGLRELSEAMAFINGKLSTKPKKKAR